MMFLLWGRGGVGEDLRDCKNSSLVKRRLVPDSIIFITIKNRSLFKVLKVL